MEKSNKKGGLVIGILVGIIVMLVIFIGLIATNIISFNSDNKSSSTSKSSEKLDNNGKSDNINTDTKMDNNRNEVVAKLKEALTNENWVKENLYSKKDCFGKDAVNANHELTFEVLSDKDNNPIVIVLDSALNDFIIAPYKVYYNNGEVKVKNVVDRIGHPSHAGFILDVKQNLVIETWGHRGDYSFTAYDVSEEEIKKFDEYKCNTGQCEYEYKGDKEYNTTGITKKLTIDNINTYLK